MPPFRSVKRVKVMTLKLEGYMVRPKLFPLRSAKWDNVIMDFWIDRKPLYAVRINSKVITTK